MKKRDIEMLELHEWSVECELPFEIRHKDGSFATKMAAYGILELLHIKFIEFAEHLVEENE